LISILIRHQRSRISCVNTGLNDVVLLGFLEMFSEFAARAFDLLRFRTSTTTHSCPTQLFFKKRPSCNSSNRGRIGGALAGVPKASRFAMARIKALASPR
jgi:hypothetical protein